MAGPTARLKGAAASKYKGKKEVTEEEPVEEEPGWEELEKAWEDFKKSSIAIEKERLRRIGMGVTSAASCCVNAAKGLATASCSSLGAIKPQTVATAVSVLIGGGILGGIMPGDSVNSAPPRGTLAESVLEASSIVTAGVAVLCAGFCAWDNYRQFPDGESVLTTNETLNEADLQTSTRLRESQEEPSSTVSAD